MSKRLWGAGLLLLLMNGFSAMVQAQGPSVGPPVNGMLTVPANTVIHATIDTPLNSGTAQIGQQVTAVTSPQDLSGLPAGSQLHGYVSDVRPRDRTQPGMISVRWYSATLPDNVTVPLDGVTTSLAPEYTYRMPGGRLVARPNPDGYLYNQYNQGYYYNQGYNGYTYNRGGGGSVLPHNFWGYTAAGAILGPTIFHTNILTGALLGGLGSVIFSRSSRRNAFGAAEPDAGQPALVADAPDQPYMDAVVPRGTPLGIGMNQPFTYRHRTTYRYPDQTVVLNNPQFVGPPADRYSRMVVTIDGRPVSYTAPLQPIGIDGLPYVPLAPALALAGLQPVRFLSPSSMEFQAPFGVGTGQAYVGQPYVTVGDQSIETGTAPMFINGQVYVTPAFMNSVYGYNGVWDRDAMRLDLRRSDRD